MCADNKGTHRRAVHTSGRAERCNAHRACNLTISKRCDDWMMGPPCNTCYTPKGLEPVGFDWLEAGFSSECCTAERAAPAAASLNASVWATVAAPFTAADNHTRPTNGSVVAAKHAHTRALVHRAAPDLTSWKLACPLLLYWLWNWSHSRGACNNKPASPHASPRDRQRWKDTYALEEDA